MAGVAADHTTAAADTKAGIPALVRAEVAPAGPIVCRPTSARHAARLGPSTIQEARIPSSAESSRFPPRCGSGATLSHSGDALKATAVHGGVNITYPRDLLVSSECGLRADEGWFQPSLRLGLSGGRSLLAPGVVDVGDLGRKRLGGLPGPGNH